MDKKSLGKLDVGRRALEFSRAHPDSNAGYEAAVGQLADPLAQAAEAFAEQHAGIRDERVASTTKQRLRREITRGHLFHLARVARMAEIEAPDLGRKFTLTAYAGTNAAFYNQARNIMAEAVARRELLLKYGLSAPVLDDLQRKLEEFQTAVGQGDEARRIHMTATAKLLGLADRVMAAVAVLSGLNRIRFANDPDRLAAWYGAINLIGPAKPAAATQPPAGGEVKPAA